MAELQKITVGPSPGNLGPFFWSRFLCAVALLGIAVSSVANFLFNIHEGKCSAIDESMSTVHPRRTAAYYDAAVAALGDHLVQRGFATTAIEPTFGGAGLGGFKRTWYQMDKTPIWVVIGRSPERDLKGEVTESGRRTTLHIDEELIVSVDWKTPGWRFNTSQIEAQAKALQTDVEAWWTKYTATPRDPAHRRPG